MLTVKEDWPHDVGGVIYSSFAPECEDGTGYNVNEAHMDKFLGSECGKLRGLLERVNLEMNDVLKETLFASLCEYVELLSPPAEALVTVRAKEDVVVEPRAVPVVSVVPSWVAASLKPPTAAVAIAPVLGLKLQVSKNLHVLNTAEALFFFPSSLTHRL